MQWLVNIVLCLFNIFKSLICFLCFSRMNLSHSSVRFFDDSLFFLFHAFINRIVNSSLFLKLVHFICNFSLFPNFIHSRLFIGSSNCSHDTWIWGTIIRRCLLTNNNWNRNWFVNWFFNNLSNWYWIWFWNWSINWNRERFFYRNWYWNWLSYWNWSINRYRNWMWYWNWMRNRNWTINWIWMWNSNNSMWSIKSTCRSI